MQKLLLLIVLFLLINPTFAQSSRQLQLTGGSEHKLSDSSSWTSELKVRLHKNLTQNKFNPLEINSSESQFAQVFFLIFYKIF